MSVATRTDQLPLFLASHAIRVGQRTVLLDNCQLGWRGTPIQAESRILMRRRELSWWVAMIIALSLLLLWVGSCEDWSWLPNAPYDADS